MPVDLVIGNSQAGPYIAGHHLARAKGLVESDVHGLIFRGERYEPYAQFTDQGVQFHPAISADIRVALEDLQPTCLVVTILGSDHWRYGISNEPRPFEFLVPELPQHSVLSQAELIPYDLLIRRFRGDLDWQFGLVRLVKTLCDLPIFQIEAPPPVENVDLMLRRLYGPFKERFEQFGCPSTSFRYKMWWLWTHLAKCFSVELGIHYIEGPAETRDANGFLKEQYFMDGVHGTDEYGMVMVDEVAKARRRMGPAGV
jgi:hypothetical protein